VGGGSLCPQYQCRAGLYAIPSLPQFQRLLLTFNATGQGFSHYKLRLALQKVADENAQLGIFNRANSVVFFRFATYTLLDSKAAKVVTVYPPPSAPVENSTPAHKRDEGSANFTAPLDYNFDNITMADVDALIAAGLAHEDFVHANITHFESPSSLSEVNGTMEPLWGDFQADSTSSFEAVDVDRAKPDKVEQNNRIPVERRISNDRITPLLKRASPADLKSARLVVQTALDQSSKLNKARLAKPLRNIYGLRPGTIVGQSTIPSRNITTNRDVSPLLTITPEIVQAAALVAEADSMENPRKVTKRAVSGSYWMEHLDRKGTVPWGDDPNYSVFRNVVDYGAVGDGVTVS
jgi:hypothetical protein